MHPETVGGQGQRSEGQGSQGQETAHVSTHQSSLTWGCGDVVISGVGCRLPQSDNMEEFRQHLLNKEDMVTEDDSRWKPGYLGVPKRFGKIKDLSKFDASFFGVLPKQANKMDPGHRILLECVCEAIVDAGVKPSTLAGSKTGVYMGTMGDEALVALTQDANKVSGYEGLGGQLAMLANRVSFFLDVHGPSFVLNTACSSSLLALDLALQDIRTGKCDAAIVGGSNVILDPHGTLILTRLDMLSADGTCKSWDASADGYCRGEGVQAVFMQKAADAKRVYATVVHSKNNCDGFKERGVLFPSSEAQMALMKEVHQEANIDPSTINYIEAHATGTVAGDPQEGNAIGDVFCQQKRDSPLLVSCLKSSIGHTEACSGTAAIAKAIISMEGHLIPANIHYKSPNPDIEKLVTGEMLPVAEHTPWEGGYCAINSFGWGGANVHTVLHSNEKDRTLDHPAATQERVFTFSGRTEEGVQGVLAKMESEALDVELQALLQENSDTNPTSHPCRGYTVLNASQQITDIQKCHSTQRPVWFVMSGMGAQWPKMGRDMLRLGAFRSSILRSDAILRQVGYNLFDVMTNGDDETFNRPMDSFMGLASIQIALIDVLRELGIKPDGMMGHSAGELGCAYADGSLTAEEALIANYYRSKCVLDHVKMAGGMAAVGMGWEELKARLPADLYAACHNSEETQTISGPIEKVAEFVAKLRQEGIFAKAVNSAGIAFHSPYMEPALGPLGDKLKEVWREPRPKRSVQWISTSVPEDEWTHESAVLMGPDYILNNLKNPVLFQEALVKIPRDAVIIEIGAHGLLLPMLKRALGSEVSLNSLMKRNNSSNLEFFQSSLGKLYMQGVDFNPLKLYPEVKFPVARGTPMISPLIKWDHSSSWDVPASHRDGGTSTHTFELDLSEGGEHEYLLDHIVGGHAIMPGAGYLELAWRACARLNGKEYDEFPVVMEDVHFHRAVPISREVSCKLGVSILQHNGHFEILDGSQLVCSGKVVRAENPVFRLPTLDPAPEEDGLVSFDFKDFKTMVNVLGGDYAPHFQGVMEVTNRGTSGYLKWTGNWCTFIDTMFQARAMEFEDRALRLTTRIASIRIDPTIQTEFVVEREYGHACPLRMDFDVGVVRCGAVEIIDCHVSRAPRSSKKTVPPTLQYVEFIPHIETEIYTSDAVLSKYSDVCKAASLSRLHELDKSGHLNLPTCLRKEAKSATKVPQTSLNGKETDLTTFLLSELLKPSGTQDIFSNDKLPNSLKKSATTVPKTLLNLNEADLTTSLLSELLQPSGTQDIFSNDKLLNSLKKERTLRTTIDVAIENTPGTKFKVCEYVGKDQVYPVVRPPNIEVRLDIFGAELPRLEEEQLTKDVGTTTWDLKCEAPSQLTGSDLVVASYVLSSENDLQASVNQLGTLLKDDGFFLVQEPTTNFAIPLLLLGNDGSGVADAVTRTCGPFCSEDVWESIITQAGFQLVGKKSDGLLNTLFLFRKLSRHVCVSDQTIVEVNDLYKYDWVEDIKEAMRDCADKPEGHNIWLRADSQRQAGVVGMINCLRLEPGGERFRCVFDARLDKVPQPLKAEELAEVIHKDLAINIQRDGVWGSFRHLSNKGFNEQTVQEEFAHINTMTRGDLSSFRWYQSPTRHCDTTDEDTLLCEVYYSALNFRDVMYATGRLPPDALPDHLLELDSVLGMDWAGRDMNGNRVFGVVPAMALASAVHIPKRFVLKCPEQWSLSEASTVPLVYGTSYYALVMRGNIQKGDTVLIHSGAGGVGQAAIAIALSYDCRVFTTCGSQEKREFLKKRFPQLTDDSFASSRNHSFETHILQQTKGRGCDLVLNSLAEDKLHASLRCVAKHGTFLEMGKYDLVNDAKMGMSVLLRDMGVLGIQLDAIFMDGDTRWPRVYDLISQGIKDGVVTPLQTNLFEVDKIEEAFRFMAQGKHIGKVVLQIREEEKEHVTCPANPVRFTALTRAWCHPQKSYIITGGLGGFGLELSYWLYSRGCRNLVLTSRSDIRTGYQSRTVRTLREKGMNIKVSTKNVISKQETDALIEEAMEMGPVGGVFHSAVALEVGLVEDQTPEMFQKVIEPKVHGAINLDSATRRSCCDSLDWFVTFSSVASATGIIGQSNYGFANSSMERLCEQRKHDGLPGLSVQWGVIGDTGLIVSTPGDNDSEVAGLVPQRILSCLDTLDLYLCQDKPVVSSWVSAKTKGKTDSGDGAGDILSIVAGILGVDDPHCLDDSSTMVKLGMDSLMGVEVQQSIWQATGNQLTMSQIRNLTIKGLKDLKDLKGISASTGSHDISIEKLEWLLDLDKVLPKTALVTLNEGAEGDTQPPVFMLSPIYGSAEILLGVASKLDRTVYGIQSIASDPDTCVEDVADVYLKLVKEKQPRGPYSIVGFCYGCSPGLDIAVQLQESGERCSLIMLDGAPRTSGAIVKTISESIDKIQITDNKTDKKENQLDAGVIASFAMFPPGAKQIYKLLLEKPSHEERIKEATRMLHNSKKSADPADISTALEKYYHRCFMGYNYEPKIKLKTGLTLIQASDPPQGFLSYGQDYGISMDCTGKVDIQIVEGNHLSIVLGPNAQKVSDIIRDVLTNDATNEGNQ